MVKPSQLQSHIFTFSTLAGMLFSSGERDKGGGGGGNGGGGIDSILQPHFLSFPYTQSLSFDDNTNGDLAC